MAKIFLVLSVIASLAAAGLGWVTYQKITEVKTTLTSTKKDLADARSTLSKTKDALTDAQSQLSATKDQLATKTAEAQTLQGKVEEVQKSLTDAQAQVADLTDKFTKDEEKLAVLTHQKTGDPNAGPDPVQQKIDELTAQLAEAKQLATTLQAKADEAEKHATALAQKEAQHQALVNKPGLEGVVMAVNPGWNFVVISIGDQKGAVANAQVIVKRGDTLIAKLKITTVEPATSIADIIPDSIAKGQRVLPGDRVIFTGATAQ